MQKADPLIRTKLRLPFIRPGLVARPRLQEQIAQGLAGPLTLVTAPAGFGKTTLVASCVAGCGMAVAWLSLDKSDNQDRQFLTYLVASFQEADPTIGVEAAQWMASIPPAPPTTILTSLVNELDSTGRELVLVLDDYQLISSQAVHEEVAFLLDHRPGSLHLVIASRSDPPLPLARLRARGQMLELRASDLRFTQTEAELFLTRVMNLPIDAASAALLEERTEGWAAGLQMAALSLRDRKDIPAYLQQFSGTNRYILDYLLEEVLAQQPLEVQRFLLCTSILERLSAPLCDILLASQEAPASIRTPSAQLLDTLDRANLFLISLDEGRVWFRYHHLFADLLRARLQQVQSERASQLHQLAAGWLEQQGYIPEAVQHLLAAQEIDRAAGLIEHYGPRFWAEEDLSVIRMAETLPREWLVRRPKLGVCYAWLLIQQGSIEKAYPLLEDLAREFSGEGPGPSQAWLGIIVRVALAFLTPRKKTPEWLRLPEPQGLDEIPEDELVLRDAASILYGMALGRYNEHERATEFSLQSIQKQKNSPGATVVPTLLPFLVAMYLFQGRLHAPVSLCREYLARIQAKGLRTSTEGNLEVILGSLLYEWNCLEEAEQRIRRGLQSNQPWSNIMTDALGQLALAHLLIAKREFSEALEVVEIFENRLQGPSRPIEFYEDCRTLRMRVLLASGDLAAVSQWADQVLQSEDFQRYPQYYRSILACIRLAQGRFADLETLLNDLPNTAFQGNRVARQIENDLLAAAASAGQQRLPEAMERVKSVLALAEPEGYIRAFLALGEPVRDLLARYLRSGAPEDAGFARKVLEAFPAPAGAPASKPQPAGLVEPLTGRELEVLELMAQGKPNPEIARLLFVTTGTVKAHAASIYRKLDVANRTEAVTRARQLGILS